MEYKYFLKGAKWKVKERYAILASSLRISIERHMKGTWNGEETQMKGKYFYKRFM
jgi:hypothetical protein